MESNEKVIKNQKKTEKSVLTQGTLWWCAFKALFLQASFNYERMQGCGYLFGILPALKKIYAGNKKKLGESMLMHMEFFNTNPTLNGFIQGVGLAIEEKTQDLTLVRNIKIATMGPLGGIGDSIVYLTALPIFAALGASMGIQGNVFGPILFIILMAGLRMVLNFVGFFYSYRGGVKAVAKLTTSMQAINRFATIVGLTVIGGLIATYVRLALDVKFTIHGSTKPFDLQVGLVDKIMPALLPALYVFFMYYLIKKGLQPIYLIIITVVLGIGLHYAHVL